MARTFYTSDWHFSHANIIIYCDRPWLRDGDLVPSKTRDFKWVSREVALERSAEMTRLLFPIGIPRSDQATACGSLATS